MSKETSGLIRDEDFGLRNLDKHLEPEEFWRRFPFLARQTIPQISDQKIVCTPKKGEHYRFGVYFYALPEPVIEKDVNFGKDVIVIPSRDLFYKCGITEELIRRGIAVNPSSYYQRLVDSEKGERDISKYGQAMEVYERIEEANITLDMSKYFEKISPPILSIPCNLSIDLGYLRSGA